LRSLLGKIREDLLAHIDEVAFLAHVPASAAAQDPGTDDRLCHLPAAL